jgi:hypothetical protein
VVLGTVLKRDFPGEVDKLMVWQLPVQPTVTRAMEAEKPITQERANDYESPMVVERATLKEKPRI